MAPTLSSQSDVRCPVCDATVTQPPLHTFTADRAAAHFCPPWRNQDRFDRLKQAVTDLWESPSAFVFWCRACEFGFAWPHHGGSDAYYAILHEQAGYPTWRWEYTYTRDHILSLFPAGGKVLDIGTGNGAFLKSLDKTKWKTFATEGSPVTRTALRAKQIECFESTQEAARAAAGTFQVVTMFQVIEHISAFRSIFADCLALLQPGGRLVLSMPRASSIFDQEHYTGMPDMIPNHCNRWSPKSLGLALRQSGFIPHTAPTEPAAMSSYIYNASLRVMAKGTTQPDTLTGKIYGLKTPLIRKAGLASMLGLSVLTCTPFFFKLRRSGSFVMVGEKPMS